MTFTTYVVFRSLRLRHLCVFYVCVCVCVNTTRYDMNARIGKRKSDGEEGKKNETRT